MSIREIIDAYSKGHLSKAEYIKAMYDQVYSNIYDLQGRLADTDIAAINITDEGVVFTSRRDAIKLLGLQGDRRWAPLEVLNFGDYERAYSDLMLDIARGSEVVLDVGANAGWYSLLFSKYMPKCEIFSFEPIPSTYNILARNLLLNSAENITAFNIGLSDFSGEVDFYCSPVGTGAASMRHILDGEVAELHRLTVSPLDSIEQLKSKNVGFIKCDVEGAEWQVFKGGEALLRRCKPAVFAEMLRKWAAKFDYHPNDLIDWFSQLGYRCYTLREGAFTAVDLVDDATVETNFFFLHQLKHRHIIESHFD